MAEVSSDNTTTVIELDNDEAAALGAILLGLENEGILPNSLVSLMLAFN